MNQANGFIMDIFLAFGELPIHLEQGKIWYASMMGSNVATTIHNGWAVLDKFILHTQNLKHLHSSTTADTIYIWMSPLHCKLWLHNI